LSQFMPPDLPPDTPPSFPARMPLLPLDRIIASSSASLSQVVAHRSALARIASDHLPVVAAWSPPDTA
jgi:endonuclease/exonuclease/phosphatase family metal-dependent hydrolase